MNPIGKIIKLGVRGFRTIMRNVPEGKIIDAVREGEDVIVGSRQTAHRVARAAGDGAPPVGPEMSPGPGNRPHYHTADRSGGHVFYSVASALTVSHYVASDAPKIVKAGAALVDFFNPLALPQDVIETVQMIRGSGSPNP